MIHDHRRQGPSLPWLFLFPLKSVDLRVPCLDTDNLEWQPAVGPLPRGQVTLQVLLRQNQDVEYFGTERSPKGF